jgi:hypothetical protein
VPLGRAQAELLGEAAVAVHDDGDVPRHGALLDLLLELALVGLVCRVGYDPGDLVLDRSSPCPVASTCRLI